jgi:hypothetical protein
MFQSQKRMTVWMAAVKMGLCIGRRSNRKITVRRQNELFKKFLAAETAEALKKLPPEDARAALPHLPSRARSAS